jgi:hypothetical protein
LTGRRPFYYDGLGHRWGPGEAKELLMWRTAIGLAIIASIFGSCSERKPAPRRYSENGFEVVDNGSGVYSLPGSPGRLSLDEEFRIDLGDERLAAEGFTDVSAVDADSSGRIYVFSRGQTGPFVFQFDAQGRFLKAFARPGQGPGEVEYPFYAGFAGKDRLAVYSRGARKFFYFDTEGNFLGQQVPPNRRLFLPSQFWYLLDGKLLAVYAVLNEEGAVAKIVLALFDSQFKKIRDIRDYGLISHLKSGDDLLSFFIMVAVSPAGFFVNWGPDGSDIAVFDLQGRMKRLVRAVYPRVPVPASQNKADLELIPSTSGYDAHRRALRTMRLYPAFQAFAADEEGRLYVIAVARDSTSGANRCDIFAPEGVRIARSSLGFADFVKRWLKFQHLDVVVKNGHAYCVREKPDGFKEVVVYSLRWS